MIENIKATRFPNGLTILTDRMTGVRSATLGFFFKVGSRNEPDELNGISHFIEHTVFKGTSRRSALDIAIEQDRLGGNMEAFTTHEETGFVIKVIDDKFEQAFDLIADMLTDPRFDENDLKSERLVIIEEMKMVDDSPEEFLGEIFSKKYFPGHPLGLSIAGTPKTVRRLDRETTQKYHRDFFNAANLVIAAAGNIDHEHLTDLAKRAFSGESKQHRRTVKPKAPKPAYPIVIKQHPDLEQAHLVIATPFTAAREKSRYAADLLANIIGGGQSSRLWQKIREERGLAYNVGASAAMYHDCGYFSVFAGTSPSQTGEVLDIAIDELRSVVRDGIASDELDLAKQQSRASILLSLEDSAARAASLASSEMTHGRQIPVEETLANIDAVTVAEIGKLARQYFRTGNVAFAALGNLNGLKVKRDRLAVS